MCGINGIISRTNQYPVSANLIETMRDQMVSRGPDDAGTYLHHEGLFRVGLGHRRLSIIDLSPLGRQPMSTKDGNLWIVFNGEVFNFKELRTELSQNHQVTFQSQTDTEVILYGVRAWGLEGCLKRLRGMYAFALFDQLENSLTLVRDPLGVKPLYYIKEEQFFAFGSEIKAILAIPWVKRRMNGGALSHYLTFANVPAPHTFFEGIYKLEAGTYLRIKKTGETQHSRYWDPAHFHPQSQPLNLDMSIQEVRRLLRQSVARRMVSDVPFGVFLSGGVDSSLNVALMAEALDRPVQTFSVGIKDDPSNEFAYAKKVAKYFGTDHHELVIDDRDFISFLPEMVWAQDEPLADPVCVPIFYISKLAHDSGTTVIQVGEGSDEIFAGYNMYHFFYKWDQNGYRYYQSLPSPIKSFLHVLARGRVAPEYEDTLRRAAMGDPLFLGNAIAFWDSEKQGLLKNPVVDQSSSRFIRDCMQKFPTSDTLLRMIQLELKNRLSELLLMRVDKMSMANSIETRVPFLDEDLVEYALTIPSDLKYKNGQTKYILKKAAEGILPDEIIYRKKWGFCGSATNMLSDGLTRYAYEKITSSNLINERFNIEYIERVFQKHKAQKSFNSFKIWNLLNLVLWYEQWFESPSRANVL